MIGKKLYEAFIKIILLNIGEYLQKNLPASIFNRLPIRFSYNEDYFNHCKYQGIPIEGYTKIFEKLLNHKNIKVLKNLIILKLKVKLKLSF